MRHPKRFAYRDPYPRLRELVSLADCTGLTGITARRRRRTRRARPAAPAAPTGGTTGAAGTTGVSGGGGSGTGVGGDSGGLPAPASRATSARPAASPAAAFRARVAWAGAARGGGGRGGSGGGAGSGGGGPTRGPTPAANGVNFPFPQNRQSSRCVYPTGYLNSTWSRRTSHGRPTPSPAEGAGGARRVQRLATDPSTRACPPGRRSPRGSPYGMMMAVYMDDQPAVRRAVELLAEYLDGNGLMNWSVTAAAWGRAGVGAATDADEDMAFALVMADKQWGSTGALNYLNLAKSQITTSGTTRSSTEAGGARRQLGPTNLGPHQHLLLRARLLSHLQAGRPRPRLGRGHQDHVRHDHRVAQREQRQHEQRTRPRVVHQREGGMSPTTAVPLPVRLLPTPFRIALDWSGSASSAPASTWPRPAASSAASAPPTSSTATS